MAKPTNPAVLLAWGDDLLLIEESVDALARALAGSGEGAPDRIRLKAEGRGSGNGSVVLSELAQRLATGGLFGGGTLVVVAGAGRFAQTKELRAGVAAALANIAPGNAVALVDQRARRALANIAPGNAVALVDQRARRPNLRGEHPEGPGELGGMVLDVGGAVVGCVSPGPGELAPWISARAKVAGREIAGDAAREIAERLGAEVREPDLDRSGVRMTAAVELEKLMLAVPSGAISVRDVDALVADRGIGSLFAFADAIVARNGPLTAKHLGRAIAEPGPMVVATLHRKFRELAQIHGAVIEDGQPIGQVAREIGIHEYPAKKLAEAARRWSGRQIADAITALVELDAISKGGGERAWGPALTSWSAARIG